MGTVAIVDYGVGNLKSVANALSYLGLQQLHHRRPGGAGTG